MASAAGQEFHRVLDVDVRGQHQDGRVGELHTDYPGRVEALGGVGRRHPNVGHYQVGRVLADQREQLCTVASLPDDVETRAFEQAGQSLAEQDVILGQDHPQGILHRADTLHRRGVVLTASIPARVGGHGHVVDGQLGLAVFGERNVRVCVHRRYSSWV
jgi:hypothetical protein